MAGMGNEGEGEGGGGGGAWGAGIQPLLPFEGGASSRVWKDGRTEVRILHACARLDGLGSIIQTRNCSITTGWSKCRLGVW